MRIPSLKNDFPPVIKRENQKCNYQNPLFKTSLISLYLVILQERKKANNLKKAKWEKIREEGVKGNCFPL